MDVAFSIHDFEMGFGPLLGASIVWGLVLMFYYPFETFFGYAANPFVLVAVGAVLAAALPPLIGTFLYVILRITLHPSKRLSPAAIAGGVSTAFYILVLGGGLVFFVRALGHIFLSSA